MQINIDDALKSLEDADAKVARYQNLLSKAEADRNELKSAFDVLSKHIPALKSALAGAATQTQDERQQPASYQSGSIADVILAIMRKAEKVWWTANELQDLASEARGSEVPMTSISPNLSKLKNNGDIVRDDLKVALAERVADQSKPPSEGLFEPQSSEGINHSGPSQSADPMRKAVKPCRGGGP